MTGRPPFRLVRTPALDIAVEVHGSPGGAPVLLLHGFPYDPRSFDGDVQALSIKGFQVFVPYLRGFGPTRIHASGGVRTASQADLACDLLDLVEALDLTRPIVAGFDWGNRAACAAAAVRPERFRGIVSIGGYTIYDLASAALPLPPDVESVLWYQFYFTTERGRRALETDRAGICRLLWKLWSPASQFDDKIFENSACSFYNPDFVDVVIHSYRHRLGCAAGDPRVADVEEALFHRPPIELPAIVLHGGAGPLPPPARVSSRLFPRLIGSRILEHSGHNLPMDAAGALSAAIMTLADA